MLQRTSSVARTLCVSTFMTVLLFLSTAATAADVPKFDQRLSIAAREQPVKDFFAELFGRLGLPVHVDPSITGTVNGDFMGSARNIYQDVEKAFQLVMYYDRSKVYIYSSKQLQRNIVPMDQQLAKKVMANAKKMRIEDSLNKVVWSDMGLVVSGTQRFRSQIESYTRAIKGSSRKVDAPREEVIRVFKLKYAWADDTTIMSGGQEVQIKGVASLLRTVIESGMVGVQRSPESLRSNLPRTENGLRGQGLQSVGKNDATVVTSNAMNQSSQSTSGSTVNSRIVADPLNNAIIIRDLPERMQSYQELINSIDIEPQMVEIEATIIDMDTDRLRSLGIDWRYQKDGTSILFGNARSTNDLLGMNPSAVAEGLNGFTQNVLNNKAQFLSHIRALESQGAARIVSKPHVTTLANVEALLDTTSTFFVRVAGREEVDLFNVSVGTTMRVTPHVLDHDTGSQIKMKIDIVDGTQSQQTVDDIPVIDESTINTQAIINAGQSLLIGGLVREIKSSGVSKVPVLGSIPGLGALFRHNRKTSRRLERMFLITPRINTQASSGKRYSVPIISGTEAQIIESAPARLNTANAALASRDKLFTLNPSLPSGHGTVALSNRNQRLPRESEYQINPSTGQGEGTSIRDRMKNRHQVPPVNNVPVQTTAPQIVSSKPHTQSQISQSESMVLHSAPASDAMHVSDQGWQAVQQASVSSQKKIAAEPDLPMLQREPNRIAEHSVLPKKRDTRVTVSQPTEDDGWTALPANGLRKTAVHDLNHQPSPIVDRANPDNAMSRDEWQEIK